MQFDLKLLGQHQPDFSFYSNNLEIQAVILTIKRFNCRDVFENDLKKILFTFLIISICIISRNILSEIRILNWKI